MRGSVHAMLEEGFSSTHGTPMRKQARARVKAASKVALPKFRRSWSSGRARAVGVPISKNSFVRNGGQRARDQVEHGNPIQMPLTKPDEIQPRSTLTTAANIEQFAVADIHRDHRVTAHFTQLPRH
eukprot:7453004-Heterocapsa_arctica.AAC.1